MTVASNPFASAPFGDGDAGQTPGTTIEEKIQNALFAAVREIVTDPILAVAWPNVSFTPTGGESYLRVDLLPNNNTRMLVKGSAPHLRQGILQLTVVTPLNIGPALATALAGSIAEQFAADLALFNGGLKLRIQAAPDVGPPIRENPSWNVVVSVRYETFA